MAGSGLRRHCSCSGDQQGATFPQRHPSPGDVPAGHGAGTAVACAGPCPGAAGASSTHSLIQQVTELRAVAAQAGSPGSAAGSSHGCRQQSTQGEEAGEALGPRHDPGPRGFRGPRGVRRAPGLCSRGCVRPTAAPAGSCSSADRPGACAWQEVWHGSGPEQSVQIEVGGKLMEMGEQLPCSSEAGRYQRAEL